MSLAGGPASARAQGQTPTELASSAAGSSAGSAAGSAAAMEKKDPRIDHQRLLRAFARNRLQPYKNQRLLIMEEMYKKGGLEEKCDILKLWVESLPKLKI